MTALLRAPDWLDGFVRSGRYQCPECGPGRGREGRLDKSLRVTVDTEGIRAHCHHCDASAIKTFGYQNREPMNTYPARRAEPAQLDVTSLTTSDRLDDHTPPTKAALSYLASRGIPAEVAALYGTVSGARYFPDRKGISGGMQDGVGFLYRTKGKHYATKWRSLTGKLFVADGAAATLWGPDILKDDVLVIAEGELDALSVFHASGIKAKSIPTGAVDNPSPGTRMAFLDHSFDDIKNASKVILCLDNDVPGRAMAKEIARRIGRAKCWTVAFPDGCKDANDVLVQHGPEALAKIMQDAEPWPVEGLSRPGEFRADVLKLNKEGMKAGFSTGIRSLDKYLTIQPGMLYVVTGRPGAGKSTFLDGVMVEMAMRLGWNWAVASFESPPYLHISRLVGLHKKKAFSDLAPADVDKSVDWVDSHFSLLTGDGMADLESIIERGKAAVTRHGIRGFIIDPYNFIRDKGREADTEYANVVVASLKAFAQAYDVAVFLVAHPAKPMGGTGQDWMPGGYSISGSANFFNRCDIGLSIGRTIGAEEMEGAAQVMIWKSRWSHLGKEGTVILGFDPLSQRFHDQVADVTYGDPYLDLGSRPAAAIPKDPWE